MLRAFAVIVLALNLPGCASVFDDSSRVAISGDEGGKAVTVLELPGVPCPSAVLAGPNGGCAWGPGWVVFGYGDDAKARAHEFDHTGGLVHGTWSGNCAKILKAGVTRWTPGHLICRAPSGEYYESKP